MSCRSAPKRQHNCTVCEKVGKRGRDLEHATNGNTCPTIRASVCTGCGQKGHWKKYCKKQTDTLHPNVTERSNEREAARKKREEEAKKPTLANIFAAAFADEINEEEEEEEAERPKTPTPRAKIQVPQAPVKARRFAKGSWACEDSDSDEE